ncbi:MAG: hypothetical protein NWF01_10905 [Candidatus Bathyarchaeota archaeon]|nr:hypothetical protein [Candidatus Bathyarchaeota archaeon]
MQFKTEISLLIITIILFAVSAFLYTYQVTTTETAANMYALTDTFNEAVYPYRGFAVDFVAAGSALMVTASISYMRRSKNLLEESLKQN